jgi:hypothetical protein
MSADALAITLLQLPAHGIGSRKDLPLPFPYVVVGAALIVTATFWFVTRSWRVVRLATLGGRPLPRFSRFLTARPVTAIVRVLVLGFWGWFVMALVAGKDLLTNPVFGVVFVLVWVGLVPISLLGGALWRGVHPMRTVSGWFGPSDGRQLIDGLGVYPAALAVPVWGWFELIQPDRATLPVLRGFVIAWVVILVVGCLWRGIGWVGSGDLFEAYASMLSRLSPWQWEDGTLRVVSPLRNLGSWQAPPGTWALACALLGTTAYDSFSSTTWWVRLVQASDLPRWLWGLIGMAAMIAIVAVLYVAGVAALHRGLAARRALLATADSLAVGLVPIVAGYALGHYLTLLVIEGQRTVIQLADPLGQGWNVLGLAENGVMATPLTYPTVTAVAQLLFIVGGHVLGVIVAHDRAVALLRPGAMRRAQLPLLIVMVVYTVGGLLLLFSP